MRRRRGARRHAEAAVVVDVGRAERDARELAQQVGLLVCQRPAAEHGDGVAAVTALDLGEPAARRARGLRPRSRGRAGCRARRSRGRAASADDRDGSSVSGADQPFTHSVPLLTGNAASPADGQPGRALRRGESRTAARSRAMRRRGGRHHAQGRGARGTPRPRSRECAISGRFLRFFREGSRPPSHDLVGEPPEGHKIVGDGRPGRAAADPAIHLFLLCFQCDHCISLLLADKR